MATFEVTIRGIALCFYDTPESTWNVILPCDDYHLAELSFDGKRVNLRDRGRAITIDFPKAAILGGGAPDNPTPPGIFNMSADYAHGQQSPVKSNLVLKDLRTSKDPKEVPYDFVHFKFPHATRSSKQLSACKYFVQEVTPEGNVLAPEDLEQKMNREIVLEFSSTDEILLVAKDLRDAAFSPTIAKFALMAAATYTLEIDNHCHSVRCPVENDFLHLYSIVEDPNKKRFQAGQFRCAQAEELTAEEDGIRTVPYGNCDPAEVIPPPG